jgi:histidinol-phosphate phosphatase family protein
MAAHSARIVFLDRDGTINVDYGYVTDPSRVELIDGAAEAIGKLKNAGYVTVVVTNQSAVGRGMATVADVESCNEKLKELLISANPSAQLDMICVATDHPDAAGPRRKPGIGMADDVRAAYVFDLNECWMIGDKSIDVEFGLNLGLPAQHCILLAEGPTNNDGGLRFPSLLEAVEHICDR